MRAAECDNSAVLDGHMLTGSVADDEQEDTHSPLLFGQKHPNWLTCQAWYSRPEVCNHMPSNFSLLKPATELLQFFFSR